MRGAIPCLPVPLAWFCLIWNVLLPGTGTLPIYKSLQINFLLSFTYQVRTLFTKARERFRSFIGQLIATDPRFPMRNRRCLKEQEINLYT